MEVLFVGTKSWWSRGDQRALELGCALALGLVGLFGALLPLLGVVGVLDPITNRDVRLEGRAPAPHVTPGGDGPSVIGTDQAELVFAHPAFGQRLLLALPEIVGSVLLIVILGLLLRMARSLRGGEEFTTRNVRRLHAIAVTVFLMSVLAPLLDAVTTGLLLRGTGSEDLVPFSVTYSFPYLLLALLIAAVAEVFRRGARLRADTEGLV
ncbi:DUF2975 domain-containing protein [Streptomyces sp. MMS24-I29]|uniref:DUF2975 domain-containing protein n=1 Tax=Streptomyces sp. MMS24-I29 TaxID=3351480 RepID=UPI003C7A7F4F